MVKLMLTAEQWTNLKFTVELASIRARHEATEHERRAAAATGERRPAAVYLAESYRKEAEMCERIEELVKSAEFAPEVETPCGN